MIPNYTTYQRAIPTIFSKVCIVSFFAVMLSCATKTDKKTHFFNATDTAYTYSGRTVMFNDTTKGLISSAAHVLLKAKSDSIIFLVNSVGDSANYMVIEINGKYHGRYNIISDSIQRITIELNHNETNEIGVFKATEASNGALLFYGVEAAQITKKQGNENEIIEYIGDSITCGFGADNEAIPCGAGTWYNGHNAYLAYGPSVARSLQMDYRLNSVSGMGMYRNWNDEDTKPVMGDVYSTTHLDGNEYDLWDFSGEAPKIVSICLGTNDLSNGDGTTERLPFNAEKFTLKYIEFVSEVFKRYPNTKLAVLTSPMVAREKNELLVDCIQNVKAHFSKDHTIEIFEFEPMQLKGCGGHPDLDDQKEMANQLEPFFAGLLQQ